METAVVGDGIVKGDEGLESQRLRGTSWSEGARSGQRRPPEAFTVYYVRIQEPNTKSMPKFEDAFLLLAETGCILASETTSSVAPLIPETLLKEPNKPPKSQCQSVDCLQQRYRAQTE